VGRGGGGGGERTPAAVKGPRVDAPRERRRPTGGEPTGRWVARRESRRPGGRGAAQRPPWGRSGDGTGEVAGGGAGAPEASPAESGMATQEEGGAQLMEEHGAAERREREMSNVSITDFKVFLKDTCSTDFLNVTL